MKISIPASFALAAASSSSSSLLLSQQASAFVSSRRTDSSFGLSARPSSTFLKVATDPKTEKPLFVDATDSNTRASVQQYYGQELSGSDDLKTNACCTAGSPPQYIQDCISKINPEVVSRYYGCGLCLPQYPLEGANILDLGCGAGRDVYIASQLVGPSGKVVGVDMTAEQLEVARRNQAYHKETTGLDNVEFKEGYLEQLADLNLPRGSFDVIISNCVINLCTDKQAVLEECVNLLKPGGELYFSDVYSNRRVPQSLQEDPVLWGECLSGALYWNDFENLARKVGFTDPRLVEDSPITVESADVERTISESGNDELEFFSATYRLWKMNNPPLEPYCEDYGQAVIYKGTMERYPSGWLLDKHHFFESGKIHPVCGNTYRMLHDTRLNEHFDFVGTWDKHYGIFEGCGSSLPYDSVSSASAGKGASTGGCC